MTNGLGHRLGFSSKTGVVEWIQRFRRESIANDDTVGALVERPTVALRVAGSISARNKYLYGLQVVVPGLALCVCEVQPRFRSNCYCPFIFLKGKSLNDTFRPQ